MFLVVYDLFQQQIQFRPPIDLVTILFLTRIQDRLLLSCSVFEYVNLD